MGQPSQLRDRGEEPRGRGGTDPRRRLQQLIADAPQRARLHAGAQGAVGVPQLCLEPGDVRPQIRQDGPAGQRQPIALGDEHVDKLAAAGDQRLQVRLQVIGSGRGAG